MKEKMVLREIEGSHAAAAALAGGLGALALRKILKKRRERATLERYGGAAKRRRGGDDKLRPYKDEFSITYPDIADIAHSLKKK